MTGLFSGMGLKSQFPIADIQKIAPGRPGIGGKVNYAEVVLRSGQELQIADFEVNLLLERPIQIMPAEAGISIVQFYHDDEETYLVPVIGWALCVDGEVRPLTPYGVHTPTLSDIDNLVYIQASDGRVFAATQGCGVYDSLEDLLDERRAIKRHRAAIQSRDAEEKPA